MYLILGLGNPGPDYERTRHNAGFMVVDELARKHHIRFSQHKHNCIYGEGDIDGCRVVISKPLTYMNESGKAAKSILKALDIPTESVIVVHDDIDVPLGKIKIKHEGGDAGQRGVRSLMNLLQTDRFTRIRVGIDRPTDKDDIVDYVLSPFEKAEKEKLSDIIDQAIQLIEQTLREFKSRGKPAEGATTS